MKSDFLNVPQRIKESISLFFAETQYKHGNLASIKKVSIRRFDDIETGRQPEERNK